MSLATCLDCREVRPIRGRGICSRCYQRRRRAGTLTDRAPRQVVPEGGLFVDQLLADTPGLTYRQLDHWCRMGWLRPDGGTGTGVRRAFPGDEVRVVQTMARLVAAGLTPAAAHRVARGERDLAPGVVVLLDPADVVAAS